jgi:hypothetical protein
MVGGHQLLRAQRFEHGRNIRGLPAQPEGRNLEVLLFGNAEPDDKDPGDRYERLLKGICF